jgi:hypothetical protein
MKKIFIFIPILAFIGFARNLANGQIVITSGMAVTPEEMVEKIVGEGIQYYNVQYIGADTARGIFTNGSTTNLGIDSGIFLTSGSGNLIPGPNNISNAGVENLLPGDSLLTSITTNTTVDASIIEFDIIPDSDTIKFRYVFGSEEYNEWVGFWQFNDVFGFFITGPNPMGGQYLNKNIAIVPGIENTPININNINNGLSPPGVIPDGPCTNCEYYVDNTDGLTLQYDGITAVLTGWLHVVPCEGYHVKMGVADASVGGGWDSGVFIEENSFISTSTEINTFTILDPPGLTEDMVEGHVEADVVFKLPNPDYAPVTLCYEIAGTAINGIDYEWIDNCISFEEGEDSASIHIVPFQDGYFEGDETIILIVENTLGCFVKYDTIELTVLDYNDMVSLVSPNTMICSSDPVELWAEVYHGFPPYTFNWEPGSYTNDTIVVSPEETTTYTVTYSDIFGETGMDSVKVTVYNGNANNIIAFSFLVENNPLLPEDVNGTILEDSVLLVLPPGQTAENLVATFSLPPCATAFINGEEQMSGVSANDYTSPVIYEVMAANGELHDWLVVVEIETGMTEEIADGMILFPNPSNGKFYLETAKSGNDPIELQIMDLTGRIVYERQPFIREKFEIDLSEQQKGLYFLRVKSGEKEINRKVIIQ